MNRRRVAWPLAGAAAIVALLVFGQPFKGSNTPHEASTPQSLAASLAGEGDALRDAGEFARAASKYEEALRLVPDSHDSVAIRHDLAALHIDAGEFERALAHLRVVIDDSPEYEGRDGALLQMADALTELGRSDEALATYKQYVGEYPGNQTVVARRIREIELGETLQELQELESLGYIDR